MRIYRHPRSVQILVGRNEFWLYAGRSFRLEPPIQCLRVGRGCGMVQIAYGSVRHFGLPARRTVGFQYSLRQRART